MAGEDPFADLVPKTAARTTDPFADLVPKKSAASDPFADLVPKQVAAVAGSAPQAAPGASLPSPPGAATKPQSGFQDYLSTSWAQLKKAPGEIAAMAKESITGAPERYKAASEAAPTGLKTIAGAANAVLGAPLVEQASEVALGSMGAELPIVGKLPEVAKAEVKAETKVGEAVAKSVKDTFDPPLVPKSLSAAAPQTRGPDVAATGGQGLIRQKIGEGERDSARAAAALDPFYAKMNAMPMEDQLSAAHYIETGGKEGAVKDAALSPVVDEIRNALDERKNKLQMIDSTAEMNFVRDYLPHQYEDPKKAEEFIAGWVGGKQGSGAALKKREYPTLADGIAAGLKPKYPNPIDATLAYTANMDRYIALNEAVQAAKDQGAVKYLTPGKQPAGWSELKGRLGQKQTPAGPKIAYAPADFARSYNNFISRGIAELDEKAANGFEAARKASNFVTMMELSLSGFHAVTMANEAVTSEVARAIGELAGGKGEGLRTLLGAPLAPIASARRGVKAQAVYLGLSPGTAKEREIVDLLTQANARMSGMDKTLKQTAMGSYWTAWKKGALGLQAKGYGKQIAEAKGPLGKAATTVGVMAENIARVAETIQAPLFEKYIPMVKNGAASGHLESWLAAHPNATHTEKVAAARQIWDSIDNRFGEMVQDNIFWNQTFKQTMQLMMRSYSWNLGTMREIGGGAVDILNPKRLSIASDKWSPRSNYVLALPLSYAFISAVYQGLKTGQPPKDMQDLIAPRTGGKDAATGKPERLSMPGYMKDVFGWYEQGPKGEAYNKLATLPRAAYEVVGNADWRGDPIRGPHKDQWLQNYLDYVEKTFGPISVRQLAQGQKKGSKIGAIESIMGLRPASRAHTDPVRAEREAGKRERGAWQRKERHEARAKAQYGGPVE